jgi:hypothetical protein
MGYYPAQIALKVRPVGCPETPVTTNLRCVTSQKIYDLILKPIYFIFVNTLNTARVLLLIV